MSYDLFSARSASLRAGLRRKEGAFSYAYPAFIPHPGQPGLGNMPGYYQPSLAGLVQFSERRFLFVKGIRSVIDPTLSANKQR